MEIQTQPAKNDETKEARSFNLSRSWNGDLQQSSLFLRLRFPWTIAFASATPWRSCPELIRVHAFEDGESPVAVLDDFEGISLTTVLKEEASNPELAFTILRRVAAALDQLHACNMAHGALKPSSILIGEGSSVRIIDWMIDWNSVPLLNLSDAAAYLSPERLSNRKAGSRADQFALGVIAHQMLLGRDAFPGNGLAEKLFRIRYVLPDQDNGATNFAAHTVYDRIFSLDPAERFDSCSAMIQELEKIPLHRSYTETRLVDVETDPVTPQVFENCDAVHAIVTSETVRTSAPGWWASAAVLVLLAFGFGILNWRAQNQIDEIAGQAQRLAGSSTAIMLENGKFRVCNASLDALDIHELAIAYWDVGRKLNVFTSTAHPQAGWVVAPATNESLTWTEGERTVWDGSVLFYSAKVHQGHKELWVSGRWDGNAEGCLHLSL